MLHQVHNWLFCVFAFPFLYSRHMGEGNIWIEGKTGQKHVFPHSLVPIQIQRASFFFGVGRGNQALEGQRHVLDGTSSAATVALSFKESWHHKVVKRLN